MGGRYLVTGVQLGMIKGLTCNPTTSGRAIIEVVDEIIEKQFVADSDQSVEEDVERIYLETP